jgi:hypothetical protein
MISEDLPGHESPYPPSDLAPPEKLEKLRLALDQGAWLEAEQQWLLLIRGFRGHSESDLRSRSRAYRGYAALLRKLERPVEAERMDTRAKSALEGAPHQAPKVQRREMTYSFMKEIRQEEGLDSSRIEEVKRRVDAQIAAAERRKRALLIGGFALLGWVGSLVLGLSGLIGAGLGLGLGGALQMKWQGSRS